MKTKALTPWYGSNRTLAHEPAALLAGCSWIGVPFAGSMSEVLHLKASTILVNDLHRHVINLARVAAHPTLGPSLIRRLRRVLLHADEHRNAQELARSLTPGDVPDIDAAEAYFVAVWQGRSARAGMESEFTGGPCVRWTGNGGSSATRFRSAVASLLGWRQVFQRCDFVVMDVFDFLNRVDDRPGHGLYLDPPFPGPGDRYKHTLATAQQHQLACRLGGFIRCRVVCRFYDHPLIRELYPESEWTWHHPKGGRTQANKAAPEVLLVNRRATEGATA